MRYVGYTTATAAAVGLATLAGVLWLGGTSAAARVQKALDNAAKAKSVKVTAMLTNAEVPGKMTHVQTMFRQGDILRVETVWAPPEMPDKPVTVADLKTRKSLHLLPQLKIAQRNTFGVEESQGVAAMMGDFAAMKAQLTGGDDKAVKAVGEEQIGGRRTKAYEITVKDPKVARAGVWTVWVDPETELPVRLADAQRAIVLNFEDWNKEFDPKLFTLDVPEGYKLTEEPNKPGPSEPEGRTVFVKFVQPAIDNAEKAKSVKVTATLEADGKVTLVRTLYRQGDLVRTETVKGAEREPDAVIVADLNTRAALLLYPQAKTARRTTLGDQEVKLVTGVMGGLSGIKEQVAGGDPQAVKDLGEEQLGGRKTRAFEVTGRAPPGVWKVWVDPTTDLPVRARLADGASKTTFTLDFDNWNEEFDAKLFRQDVPAGYKEVKE
jgi:outer membrane lipoprotein-sorting protein